MYVLWMWACVCACVSICNIHAFSVVTVLCLKCSRTIIIILKVLCLYDCLCFFSLQSTLKAVQSSLQLTKEQIQEKELAYAKLQEHSVQVWLHPNLVVLSKLEFFLTLLPIYFDTMCVLYVVHCTTTASWLGMKYMCLSVAVRLLDFKYSSNPCRFQSMLPC